MNENYKDLSYFINQNTVNNNFFKSGSEKNYNGLNLNKHNIIDCLKKIFDPELPVSIYDLGLIYKIDILEKGKICVEMSLTAPACPVAGELPKEVAQKISEVNGVGEVEVKLVWEPAWTKDRMTEDAKLLLGID